MMGKMIKKLQLSALTLILGLLTAPTAFASVTIQIQNADGPSTGFNDPTPVLPIGGNNGTTLGQQRLIAFQFAASVWASTLNGNVPITINAKWSALSCTVNAGTLGSAGAAEIEHDFPNAPFPNTWYSVALANELAGTDLNGSEAEINATFNVNVGTTGCLEGSPWYLGLDGNEGNGTDLVAVLLHEFGHGLGFQTFTNSSTGSRNSGLPSIYDKFLFDNSTNKTWEQMTDAERAASAINTAHLTWNGPHVVTDVPNVLGTPRLRINSPAAIAGNYTIGTALFGPPLSSPGITSNVIFGSPTDGCSAMSGAVSGKIAYVDRGNCNFTVKVKNAQNAGALAVIIGNVASSVDPNTAPIMAGADATITIPSVSVSVTDANSIKAQLAGGVNASIFLDHTSLSGADSANRALMYAPNPVESGSSVSHFDKSEFPNQLMEPDINDDLTHSVMPPQDLTFDLLRDLGWNAGASVSTIQLSQASYSVGEGAGSIIITVNRSGDTSGPASVDYKTIDTDTFLLNCADTVNNAGGAFGRCDYATTLDTLTFAAGQTSKSFSIPIINDSFAEGNETFGIVLSNVSGATLGTAQATITINDNETVNGTNPIFTTSFFVRQHYLDFLSREPEAGEPWSAVLNNCPDVNNDPSCDRLTVSAAFFGSPEFQLKGYFVYRFYELAFNRLPTYTEIVTDMRAVTGQTPTEVFQKKAAFTNAFVQRQEFINAYNGLSNAQYVTTLMGRYGLTTITTPDPAAPDGTTKVTLSSSDLQNRLNGGTLTRAQVLRAIADSDQVFSQEFNRAFVAMQYFGYLRRAPDTDGYNAWLNYLNTHPNDSRTMVNGFMNSLEYRLRFGPG
jgi:hypothetical protein